MTVRMDRSYTQYVAVPVECQNGHKAHAHIEINGLETRYLGVPQSQKCKCPKWGVGEGWAAIGRPEFVERIPQ